jgi:hypothetical protein
VVRRFSPRRFAALLIAAPAAAYAGPPYVTDDPQPTDFQHYEVYFYDLGTAASGDFTSQAGIDFNYGGLPNLQLTAVIPVEFDDPAGGASAQGLGNIQLAAKYRFLHAEDIGWDVSVFPRVFLPSATHSVGDRDASVLLPFWVERDWGRWSTFGGGGCQLNHGGDATNFCIFGWVLTHKVTDDLELGAEVYYQGADARGAKASTGLGAGLTYDLSEHLHLMGSIGPGLQNAAQMNLYTWYAALLLTY